MVPWQFPAFGIAGELDMEALLFPYSTLPVGYGDGGDEPWSFHYPVE